MKYMYEKKIQIFDSSKLFCLCKCFSLWRQGTKKVLNHRDRGNATLGKVNAEGTEEDQVKDLRWPPQHGGYRNGDIVRTSAPSLIMSTQWRTKTPKSWHNHYKGCIWVSFWELTMMARTSADQTILTYQDWIDQLGLHHGRLARTAEAASWRNPGIHLVTQREMHERTTLRSERS